MNRIISKDLLYSTFYKFGFVSIKNKIIITVGGAGGCGGFGMDDLYLYGTFFFICLG